IGRQSLDRLPAARQVSKTFTRDRRHHDHPVRVHRERLFRDQQAKRFTDRHHRSAETSRKRSHSKSLAGTEPARHLRMAKREIHARVKRLALWKLQPGKIVLEGKLGRRPSALSLGL